MSLEEITENWKSIQNGNNTFATGEQSDVDDENCILILRRRLLRLHAAEYHDVIRNLHLKDDATDGDKTMLSMKKAKITSTLRKNAKRSTAASWNGMRTSPFRTMQRTSWHPAK